MPELPEVETTCRGIAPYLLDNTVSKVTIRNYRLRWPVNRSLPKQLASQKVNRVDRRGKYILLYLDHGCLLLHLGMSGSLRITDIDTKPETHDHFDLVFADGVVLRLRDPRRFGSVHFTHVNPFEHKLLVDLGPEPLGIGFNGGYLFERSRGRKQAIKTFIMDSRIVVGVGNIYANEALFSSAINPRRAAGRISLERHERLADAIKEVLNEAIRKGGTTLRDFVGGEGRPGYFRQELKVYERAGEPCLTCGGVIKRIRQGQRSSFYCAHCQRY